MLGEGSKSFEWDQSHGIRILHIQPKKKKKMKVTVKTFIQKEPIKINVMVPEKMPEISTKKKKLMQSVK